MSILKSQVVPKNSGAAFEVLKGQRIRIAGRSIVDFVSFNLRDLTERFDQARTKTNQVKIFISTGDVLYSKRNNPMMTIVADTFVEGRHDLQKGMCSRKRFEMVAQGQSKRVFAEGVDINPKTAEEIPTHGCWENLSGAVKPWNITPDDVPSPFNIFQCMRIDPDTGVMYDTMIRPQVEAHIDFAPRWICWSPPALVRSRGEGRRSGWKFTTSFWDWPQRTQGGILASKARRTRSKN